MSVYWLAGFQAGGGSQVDRGGRTVVRFLVWLGIRAEGKGRVSAVRAWTNSARQASALSSRIERGEHRIHP